jgi:hypothetical protein
MVPPQFNYFTPICTERILIYEKCHYSLFSTEEFEKPQFESPSPSITEA